MSIGPLMIDLEGVALTPEDEDLLCHPAVGGVILFARNFQSPGQLIALTEAIHQMREPRLLIAVDQEGGRVQRFRDGFIRLPPAAWYGQQYQTQPEEGCRVCELAGWLMAAELRCVGVDFSFAPVLDLDLGLSQVIGDRAFAGQPRMVAELALAWMRGVQAVGMRAVGKHFPGHGAVQVDSHLELPIDGRPLEALLEADLVPFAQLIQAGLAAIMPAHVRYPLVDEHPAGFSARWLKGILRARLGFQGVIFSDDLSMGGAQVAGGYAARARAALAAGCDMVLACNHRPGALEIAEALADYADPAAQARLLCMQGRPDADGGRAWEAMRLDQRWQEAMAALSTGTPV